LENAFSSLENINLNVAVIGESGEDRVNFINTFRDICEEDEGAALTGKTETHKTAVAYPHPKYPKVILWDLPDVGNPGFSAKRYMEKMEVASYDFFLIIASHHFKSFHAKLAHYLKKAGKGYYFVRSKVEADLESVRQSNPSSFNEIVTLQKIREDSMLMKYLCAMCDFPFLFVILPKRPRDCQQLSRLQFVNYFTNVSHLRWPPQYLIVSGTSCLETFG
uniref:IRG-type G domain-containing protein n=1 Tax=Laticauda laticaudata TaxID=8630 RepID=A0A8C5WWT5_LATLA